MECDLPYDSYTRIKRENLFYSRKIINLLYNINILSKENIFTFFVHTTRRCALICFFQLQALQQSFSANLCVQNASNVSYVQPIYYVLITDACNFFFRIFSRIIF